MHRQKNGNFGDTFLTAKNMMRTGLFYPRHSFGDMKGSQQVWELDLSLSFSENEWDIFQYWRKYQGILESDFFNLKYLIVSLFVSIKVA